MAAGQLWDELRRRPAPGEAAGSELLTRAEAAAGRRGAGVTRRAAPGARARGVAPGGHRALEQGGRAAPRGSALAWRSLSPAVDRRGSDASPTEACAATLCDANKTRKQRLSQVFGALSLLRHGAHRAVRAARTRRERAQHQTKQPLRPRTCAAQPEHRNEDPPRAARLRTSGNSRRLRRRLEHGRETSRFWSRLPRAII